MLASRPSPEAGKRLRAARLRAHLSTRQVERLSHEIAKKENNPECCISHGWLTQVENGDFRPGIYKLYTLGRIYRLKPEEILAFFGLGLHDQDGGLMSLNLPQTHLEILMTDDSRGTLHSLLHVRAPEDVRVPWFTPQLYPTLRQSREDSAGANLRFKTPELAAVGRRRRSGAW